MKRFRENKYFHLGAMLLGVVTISTFLLAVVLHLEAVGRIFKTISGVLSPLVIGLVLAYLMNPLMNFLDKRLLPALLKRNMKEEKARTKVRSPKASTIFSAVAARMPLTAPEERYFRSCPAVEGRLRSQSSARNWRPKEACTSQCPISRSSSPADSAGRTPTTVTSSPSLFKSSTVKPVSGR